jgi:hypothetical protein
MEKRSSQGDDAEAGMIRGGPHGREATGDQARAGEAAHDAQARKRREPGQPTREAEHEELERAVQGSPGAGGAVGVGRGRAAVPWIVLTFLVMTRPIRATRRLRSALSIAIPATAALILALAPWRAGAQPTTTAGDKLETLSAATGSVLDTGTFIISQYGKPVRAEEFAIELMRDTLLVRAASMVSLPGQDAQPPDKSMILLVGPLDFAMGSYWSQQSAGADTLRRGVEVTAGDTVMTIWREFNRSGAGDLVAQPPGRMYILDPPLFITFNFLGRTLHGKVCDRRPIKVFVLGARDSMVDATVTDVGNETIRWGGRPVLTRKLVIADEATAFTGWYSTEDGRMFRLEQARDSIRVDRKAPPLKRQPPRK